MSDRSSSVGLEGVDKSSIEYKINKQQIEQRKRETKALLAWSNTFLKERGMAASSILKDFADGVLLINIVEVAFGASLGSYKLRPTLPFHKHENVNLAFDYLEKTQGVTLLGIDSHHIVVPAEKQVINVLWAILRCLTMKGISSGDHKKANVRETLLNWIKTTTDSALTMKDFWDSWKDGIAFCHIVDKLCPGHIKVQSLDPKNGIANLQLAFRVAEEQLGIPSLLQPEDFADDQKPNEQAVMNYVCMLISTANTLAKKNQDMNAMQQAMEKKKKEDLAKYEELQAKKDAELAQLAEEKRRNEEAQKKMESKMEEIRQLQLKAMEAESNVKEQLKLTETEKKAREDQIAQQMELFQALQTEMNNEREQAKQFLQKREQELTDERNDLQKIIDDLRKQLAESEQRNVDLTNRNHDLQAQLYDAFKETQEVIENFQAEMKRSTLKERVSAAAHKDDYEKLVQDAMLSQKTFKDFIKTLPEKNGWLFKARPDAKLKGHVFQPRFFHLKGDTVFYSKEKDAKGKDVKQFSLEHYQLISRSNTLGDLKLHYWYDNNKKELHVTVIGARDLKAIGSSGRSDPFVEIRIMPPDQDKTKRRRSMIVAVKEALSKPKPLATTKVATGLKPNWDEGFIFPMDEERVRTSWLEFDVLDKNLMSDELIGKVVVDLSVTPTSEEAGTLDWIELRKVNSKNGSQIIQLLPRDLAEGKQKSETPKNKDKGDKESKILEISSMVEIEDQGGEKKVGWFMRQWNARKADLDLWVEAINSRISLISYLGENYQQRMARGGREFVSFTCSPDAELLKIENKIIDVEGCLHHLLEPLAFRPNLRLELKNVGLTDAGVQVIARIVAESRTIKSLDLTQNQITHSGAFHLAEALKRNKSLTTLNLDENPLSDEGVIELSMALGSSPQVKICSLRGCSIGDVGCSSLARALAAPSSEDGSTHVFPSLELSNNSIGDEGCKDIADLLEKNSSVTSVQLDHNVIADAGVGHLVNVLSKPSNQVKDLRLSHNNVSSEGVIKLALVFKSAIGRFSCDLSGNPLISKKGVSAVLSTDAPIDFKLLHLVRNEQGMASPRGMEMKVDQMSTSEFLKQPTRITPTSTPRGSVSTNAPPSSNPTSTSSTARTLISPPSNSQASILASPSAAKSAAITPKAETNTEPAKQPKEKEVEKESTTAATAATGGAADAGKALSKEEEKARRKAELKRQKEELDRENRELEANLAKQSSSDAASPSSKGGAGGASSPKLTKQDSNVSDPASPSGRARGNSSTPKNKKQGSSSKLDS